MIDMARRSHYHSVDVYRVKLPESAMPIEHMPSADLPLFLSHPAWGFLAGLTDDLILKAYARHHQTIRQVPWRGWELDLIPVNIKDGPAQTTHSMVMILGRTIHAQTVPRATDAATQ